jgi:PDZ domain-containing protein
MKMKNKINNTLKYFKENIVFFITLIVIIIAFNVNLPYSIYSPGGVINVGNRLEGEIYQSQGNLNLTYVTFLEGKIPNLLLALFLPEWDIVKNSDVTFEEETLEELNLKDRIHLYESISNATYLAYKKAGYNIEIANESIYIINTTDYADTNLKIGDKILSVDEKTIHNFDDLLNIINSHEINDKIKLNIIRNSKELECYAVIKEDNFEKKIGIGISKINEYKLDPNIQYNYKNNESGASGGLMLSLALYNALIEEDITKGKNISGTGTISEDGTVGEISGVKYKLSGAVKNNSDIFIAPRANYEEALKEKDKNNYKIDIIVADTFDQVLEELQKYSQSSH